MNIVLFLKPTFRILFVALSVMSSRLSAQDGDELMETYIYNISELCEEYSVLVSFDVLKTKESPDGQRDVKTEQSLLRAIRSHQERVSRIDLRIGGGSTNYLYEHLFRKEGKL